MPEHDHEPELETSPDVATERDASSAIIYSENRDWFDRMSPEKQADFLQREHARNTAMREHGIEPLEPNDF